MRPQHKIRAILLIVAFPILGFSQDEWEIVYTGDTHFHSVHFVDAQVGYATTYATPYCLYRTTDGGFTWEEGFTQGEITPYRITFFDGDRGHICGGTRSAVTYDGGENWEIVSHPDDVWVTRTAYLDSLTMVGCSWRFWGPDSSIRDISRSSDGGLSWELRYQEPPSISSFVDIACSVNRTSIVTGSGGEVWRSIDEGYTWNLDSYAPISSNITSPDSALFFVAGSIPTPTGNSPIIARSTDDGLTWETIWSDTLLTDNLISDIVFSDTVHGWIVGSNGLVVSTSDGGASWDHYFIDSVDFSLLDACFLDSMLGWAVDPGGGGMTRIFRYTRPQTIVSKPKHFLSAKVKIISVYPNPFNSSTRISFELVQPSAVHLDVFDLLGRYVETLVDESLSPGMHTVRFDARKLPSGLYFYRLQANQTTETRKMLLIK